MKCTFQYTVSCFGVHLFVKISLFVLVRFFCSYTDNLTREVDSAHSPLMLAFEYSHRFQRLRVPYMNLRITAHLQTTVNNISTSDNEKNQLWYNISMPSVKAWVQNQQASSLWQMFYTIDKIEVMPMKALGKTTYKQGKALYCNPYSPIGRCCYMWEVTEWRLLYRDLM